MSVNDYERADSVSKLSDLVYNEILSVNWIDSTQVFWYNVRTTHEPRYFLVNAEKQEKTEAFDHNKLSSAIERVMSEKTPADKLWLKNLKFHADLQEFTFEKKDTVWKCKLEDYSLEQVLPVRKPGKRDYFGNSRDDNLSCIKGNT